MNTKRSSQSVKMSPHEIAEKAMPGWRAITSEAVADARENAESDAHLPSLAELKSKYLGADAVSDAANIEEEPTDTTEVVTLQSGELKRKVGVNTEKGVVTWRQG